MARKRSSTDRKETPQKRERAIGDAALQPADLRSGLQQSYFSSTIKLTTNHSPTTQNITSHRPEEAPRVAIDLCGPAPQSISSGESLQRLSGTSFLWSLQLERLECTAHTNISCRFALDEAISRARGGSQRCIPGPHTGANSNPPISWHRSRRALVRKAERFFVN